MPLKDAWGNDLYYESVAVAADADDDQSGRDHGEASGAGGSEGRSGGFARSAEAGDWHTRFRIYSFGRDGLPDGDLVYGVWLGYRSDIVYEGSFFIQATW